MLIAILRYARELLLFSNPREITPVKIYRVKCCRHKELQSMILTNEHLQTQVERFAGHKVRERHKLIREMAMNQVYIIYKMKVTVVYLG